MKKSRRQIVTRIAEAVGLGVVALDLAVFFAIYQPLGTKVAELETQHAKLRQTVRDQQVRVDLLKKFKAALPQTSKGLEDFLANRIPSRREAFSTVAHLLHKDEAAAGVNIAGIIYRLDSEQQDPLQRMEIDVSVQGPYAGLMQFSHALETADDLIFIRQFTLSPGENGALLLRLGADLYLTP